MKSTVIGGIILAIFAGGGYLGYQYLNPEDVVVDEEIPTISESEQELPQGVLGMPDEDLEGDGVAVSLPADGQTPTAVELQTESTFQQGDSTYTIDGDLIVTQSGDDRSLAFADFSVTAGPDLFVYLVNTADTSNEGVKAAVEAGEFVNVATLKGNVGNQVYQVPAEIDLDDYTVVSVWCKQFGRNFGHAVIE